MQERRHSSPERWHHFRPLEERVPCVRSAVFRACFVQSRGHGDRYGVVSGALGYAGTPAADVTLFPRPALESPGPLLGGPWCQGTSRWARSGWGGCRSWQVWQPGTGTAFAPVCPASLSPSGRSPCFPQACASPLAVILGWSVRCSLLLSQRPGIWPTPGQSGSLQRAWIPRRITESKTWSEQIHPDHSACRRLPTPPSFGIFGALALSSFSFWGWALHPFLSFFSSKFWAF